SDHLDNDGDGFVDCDDWDCNWNPLLNPQAADPTSTAVPFCEKVDPATMAPRREQLVCQ
ncbi:MAG: hypothetical protein GW913_07950, partial [Myxococcales bacterium]|nr:hypothetical protein [Myxococcales bacterium]